MSVPLAAPEMLEREFLPIRAKILEIAAALDRLDRSEGSLEREARMKQIRFGIEALLSDTGQRAEAIQLIFSLPYDQQWWKHMDMDALRNGRASS